MKSQAQILAKLNITALNPMQLEARKAILHNDEVILLSPTGTGKTLAFLLPILNGLSPKEELVQALVLVPSRELAIQIEQVLREMGSGYRVASVYGGRPGSKERQDLKNPPAILIGTPGRVADHLRREAFDPLKIKTLVLDEFDKSLETGFEKEMKQIVGDLPNLRKKILTSATDEVEMPDFMRMDEPMTIDYLGSRGTQLKLLVAVSDQKDKLDALEKVLGETGQGRGIIFCNVKSTLRFVADFLDSRAIDYGVFMGGLEQTDRERALIKFRNGTHRILLATDLAARGIDVPGARLHYPLPNPPTRSGIQLTAMAGPPGCTRTERPTCSTTLNTTCPTSSATPRKWISHSAHTPWKMLNGRPLYVSGGRKDKISKGDLAGLFFKQGGLARNELGVIELLSDCTFVAVPRKKAEALVALLNNSKVKKRKVRISEL